MDHTTSDQISERRRHQRFAVTLSARLHHAERCYRTCVLDVSDGGLLLSAVGDFPAMEGQLIQVEALPVGKVKARIVGISARGLHVRVEGGTMAFSDAIKRLAAFSQTWMAG